MISSQKEFHRLIDRARNTDSVGLDTEFVWERTYYPRLGLIQLALSDEDCYLIDPLAIGDLKPLGRLLADPNVVKILHDAPQDLTILSRVTGSVARNIFDTRIAAGFSGLSSTISLADLISELLDINLPKTQTRTNWLKRPLDPSQIDYALDDVRYLRALRILLLARIIVPEIRDWLNQDLEKLDDPLQLNHIEDRLRYLKIKGSGSLDRTSLAILRELAAWREEQARDADRPRGHVISDKTLVALAREKSTSAAELSASELLSSKKFMRFGGVIIDCIKRGLATAKNELPGSNKQLRLNAEEKATYEQLIRFMDLKCTMQGIDMHLVGSNSEFRKLIKYRSRDADALPPKFTEGWRKQFVEEFFSKRR